VRVVIAPDSYKGTLTAREAARAIAQGIQKSNKTADIVIAPMADGGEGTIPVWSEKKGGKRIQVTVIDPLSTARQASYLSLPDGEVVIELAAASGILFVPVSQRTSENALRATTYGTGELIVHALEHGAEYIVIALGGSATTDGGYGLLRALGAVYYDAAGNILDGRDATQLQVLDKIDIHGLHPRFFEAEFTLACDVTNPLCGENGAAHVFGPQKGLMGQSITKRDSELNHFATLLEQAFAKRTNIAKIPASGAAGGTALPILAAGIVKVQSGASLIGEVIELEKHIAEADFVLTGEGRVDSGTLSGKVPFYVAELAAKYDKPCGVIAGVLGEGHEELFNHGVTHMIAASPKQVSQAELEKNAATWLQVAAYHVFLDMVKDKRDTRTKSD
jgi:glycerate 2-kinase